MEVGVGVELELELELGFRRWVCLTHCWGWCRMGPH